MHRQIWNNNNANKNTFLNLLFTNYCTHNLSLIEENNEHRKPYNQATEQTCTRE